MFLFSCYIVSDSATPLTAAHQASLSFTNSWSLLQFMSIELMMPSNLCRPLSCYLQSFPASGSFPRSWLFASGGQSIGASASLLTVNIQGRLPLELTGLISLLSKGLSRVFSRYLAEDGQPKEGQRGKHSKSVRIIIARTWKQPRCPSADEWIRKLWYIYTMEY